MISVIKSELFRLQKITATKVLFIISFSITTLGMIMFKLDEFGFFGSIFGESSVHFFEGLPKGFLPSLVGGYGAGILQYAILTFGIIILAGDYTHNRFKNYIHLKKSRGEIFFGKYIAVIIASVIFYIASVAFSAILSLILFGVGEIQASYASSLVAAQIGNISIIIFIPSFVAFLANVLKAKGGVIVAFYFLKGIALGMINTSVQFTKFLNNGGDGIINRVLDHWINNGTQFFTVNYAQGNGDLFSFIIYNILYVVILVGFGYLSFNKKEISN